jgi:16S rRNA (guanine1207-N2)-methyltransferase
MQKITLTDLPAKQCCREDFRDGAFRVFSRSGLHPTERVLLENLPRQATGDILVAGNRSGVLGLVLAAENPDANVVQHVLDIHHAKALQRTLAAHDGARILVECAAFLPESPASRLALLQATSHDTPAELILDQLEDLRAKLPDGATCLVAYDGKPDWLRKQMKEIFGRVSATPAADDVTLFRATNRTGAGSPPFVRRDFSATFTASLPGDPPLPFTTLPGVFAHRRADEGGLALAEVAARTLAPGARVLDMGCGCGLVGLLLARHAAVETVLCADSHTRAIHCTERNAQANALTGVQTLLTDGPSLEAKFSVFVGNPPYYSDYRIAELFIRTAHQSLAPGGTAFIVAKSHRWHEECMQAVFENAEVIKRRGYGVVKSILEAKRTQ